MTVLEFFVRVLASNVFFLFMAVLVIAALFPLYLYWLLFSDLVDEVRGVRRDLQEIRNSVIKDK